MREILISKYYKSLFEDPFCDSQQIWGPEGSKGSSSVSIKILGARGDKKNF